MSQVAGMDGEANGERRVWGLSASAAVHALVAALVIFGLPKTLLQPQEEQAISVTIEPPPEKPPEPAKPQPPPPPPKAEAAEPPQPAPQAKPATPIPGLDPVVKFGERDAGPRRALAGSGAEDAPDPPLPTPAADEDKAAQDAKPEQPEAEQPPAAARTPEPVKDEDSVGPAVDQLAAAAASSHAAVPSAASRQASPAKPASEPKKLREARTLFSRSAAGGRAATTAMAGVPRGIRAGRLCATELRLQLLNDGHFPDLLPSYELKEGTVLAVRRGAFRAGGSWHNLAFECQVDSDATGVLSFAFRVGDRLPPDEARRRGLPSR
ncbi:MAG: DUF930 domain-containing protein [Rhizobiaceae bacterium]|nr:DUF930 domain-containing protein [Rhizobiaceae bacterium]